ncbi:C4-dicarboxylate ABC transporter substrate-binding protein [Lentzea pudingi]|uniref:C4-dicarboxylate ABC transporter substrate-binding protein n=1 Tax=Lentzea pudingi TaxID=1789439 RepID=A0ABQ2I7Q0_9PSEU|nr:TAXI family TRAP transporter solute-binding subunit [Lentzea pudingi]GGN01180.1 C4-dicarboxylate ABC transporter substrate-binding protein [Lentzea pudingi]
MKRRTFLLGALALTACGTGEPDGTIRIAGGEPGGFYNDFAALISRLAPSPLTITPIQTGGSADNLQHLREGNADIGLSLSDSAHMEPGLVALGRVYENYLQLVVLKDSPYTTAADLVGKPVSLGADGSGAALQGSRLALGVQEEHYPLRNAIDALKSGEIAALLWSGGVPTPELDKASGIRLLALDGFLPRLRQDYGKVYERVDVRTGVYGSPADVPTIGTPNLLVCRPDLSAAFAGAVVRLLVGRAAELVPEQALGTQYLDVRSLIDTGKVPLHPGAAAEYRRLHG